MNDKQYNQAIEKKRNSEIKGITYIGYYLRSNRPSYKYSNGIFPIELNTLEKKPFRGGG